MIALLQRVSRAEVVIGGQMAGRIGRGLLALVCAERNDSPADADWLADRLLRYRVFSDSDGRMNLSLTDLAADYQGADHQGADPADSAGLLLVPQFTLAADTSSGLRPSFTPAAPPELGSELFDYFVAACRSRHDGVAQGRFGADMQVELVNDGPVTFWLQNKRSS